MKCDHSSTCCARTRFENVRLGIVPAAILLTIAITGTALAQSTETDQGRLIAVLESDAPTFDKAMACRRLAEIGNAASVAPLAGLLGDRQLATYARAALESITDPAAGRALLEAMDAQEGDLLIGVLGSIGRRRDAMSVDRLSSLLYVEDGRVVAAAAKAIAEIGSGESGAVLMTELMAKSPHQAHIASACLTCAQRLSQAGHHVAARSIHERVSTSDVPERFVLAATKRLISLGNADNLDLLARELRSPERAAFRMGLQSARDLGAPAEEILIGQYGTSSPDRKALILRALADIDAEHALALFVQAAEKSQETDIRLAAIDALGRSANADAIPMLREAAMDPTQAIAEAAVDALAELDSGAVKGTVEELLTRDDERSLTLGAMLAGRRHSTAMTPALFALVAETTDAPVRLAAITALGSTAALGDLQNLITLAATSADSPQQEAAWDALRVACARLPQEECGGRLAAAMSAAAPAFKVELLEQLTAVGGERALQAVSGAAESADDQLVDAATRLLGTWKTADAAPNLLRLAKSLGSGKYKDRALRGYVRIARQLNMTPTEQVEVCRNTLLLADRAEESRLALQTLASVGTSEALELCVAQLDNPDLQLDASESVLTIVDQFTGPSVEAKRAIDQVIVTNASAEIVKRARRMLSVDPR